MLWESPRSGIKQPLQRVHHAPLGTITECLSNLHSLGNGHLQPAVAAHMDAEIIDTDHLEPLQFGLTRPAHKLRFGAVMGIG